MISFFCPGQPQTKGSSRAFVVKGRAVVTNDNPKNKAWQERVAIRASEAMIDNQMPSSANPWTFPVIVSAMFYLQRPRSHYGKKGLLASAPAYPGVKPDADKLARSLCDALEKIVYHHDALVVSLTVRKLYADDKNQPGVHVIADKMGDSAPSTVAVITHAGPAGQIVPTLPGVPLYTFEVKR